MGNIIELMRVLSSGFGAASCYIHMCLNFVSFSQINLNKLLRRDSKPCNNILNKRSSAELVKQTKIILFIIIFTDIHFFKNFILDEILN